MSQKERETPWDRSQVAVSQPDIEEAGKQDIQNEIKVKKRL